MMNSITTLISLADKATDGPWDLVWHGNEQYPFPFSVYTKSGDKWITRDGTVSSKANAELYVAARNAVPAIQDLLTIAQEMAGALECWKLFMPINDGDTLYSGHPKVMMEEALAKYNAFKSNTGGDNG